LEALYDFLLDRLKGIKRLAVLGAGSVLRGDDAAGDLVIQKMSAACCPDKYPDVRFYSGETAPENYAGKIISFSPTHFLVIDAADVGAEPGDIVDIDPKDVGGPLFLSHMLPLKIMIDFIKSQSDTAVTLLGIQYKSIEFDADVTHEMKEAVDELCNDLKKVIDDLLCIEP
jgi:hydrogenase 3 maturation protease